MENYYGELSNSVWAHKFEFLDLSVGRMYGVQCQVPEQCRFSGDHAECVKVGNGILCQCAVGYHFVDEIKLCVENKGECLLFVQYLSSATLPIRNPTRSGPCIYMDSALEGRRITAKDT